MNTYAIETTNGLTIIAEGDYFGVAENQVTGEFQGYEVTNNGDLAAFIAPGGLISVEVKVS